MRKGITWKIAIVGGAVAGAGFGSVALAGADSSAPPAAVQLTSIPRQLLSAGAPISVPAAVDTGISVPARAVTVDSVPSPAPAPAPAADDSPASPVSVQSPASPVSVQSPASAASAPSAPSVDS